MRCFVMYKRKDPKRTWPKCSENHNHEEQFIPIKNLKQSDLPEGCKSDTLDEIKSLSVLTVRIEVIKDKSNSRAKNIILSGTGTVVEIMFKNQLKGRSKLFSTPNPRCIALIRIKTACHVISSDSEAKNSSVDFFYDDADDLGGAKTLRVDDLHSKNVKEDWSVVDCFTDDKELAKVLSESLDRLSKQARGGPKEESGIAVVVSHPHGMTKYVSVGQWSLRGKSAPESCKRNPQIIRTADFPLRPNFEFVNIPGIGDASHLADFIIYKIGFIETYSYYSLASMPSTTIYITFNVYSLAIVNQNGLSEAVGIECEVNFPDGEISMRQIWRFDKPVKDTKLCLMSEGNINFPEEELYLELDLPDGQTQIMEDSKDIEYYWDDLLCTDRIRMKRR